MPPKIIWQHALLYASSTLIWPSAQAAEFEFGEGKLIVTGAIFAGTVVRTDKPDPTVLPDNNSRLVGIKGGAITPSASRNQDDGNLNFKQGDAVSTVLKGYLSLEYKLGDFGAVLSGKAWHDYALTNQEVPWGNLGNNYAADQPLSDRGANPYSAFSGVQIDNAHGYGHHQNDNFAVDWKLGWQKIDWGQRFIILGGLRDLTPVDFAALVRPGTLRDEETRIAIPALSLNFGLTQNTSLEGFYQFSFTPNAPNHCGTFIVQGDFSSPGCDKLMFGNISDREAIKTGRYLRRAETPEVSNSGQFGLALRHKMPSINTDLGFFATQFHSRQSFYSAYTAKITTGTQLFNPATPDLNPKYFTEYPEEIRMFGTSFETRFRGGAVYGELSYRPNQPLQYNGVDLLNAALLSSNTASPLSTSLHALSPGAKFKGWEAHKAVQLQLGSNFVIPKVLGAAGLSLGGEMIYKGIPDLPDQGEIRFGRADVFGSAGWNGAACAAPATEKQCSRNGYVSRHAFGYRLRAGLRYAEVVSGVDLTPSIFFAHDVSGWAGDNTLNEGRMLAILSLRADFQKKWGAQIAWQPTWGGAYNNQSDRSTVQANLGYTF